MAQPALARECFEIACPALLHTGRVALARRFVPSPAQTLAHYASQLTRLTQDAAPAGLQKLFLRRYVRQVEQLLRLLRASGEAAAELAAQAVASAPGGLRPQVAAALPAA